MPDQSAGYHRCLENFKRAIRTDIDEVEQRTVRDDEDGAIVARYSFHSAIYLSGTGACEDISTNSCT